LNSLADERCGMLAHPVAYVGALALLAIVGIHLWDQLPAGEAAGVSAKSLERGHALASGVCRQSVRFCPKNRDLRDPPAPRERPQGHLARGRRGRKARPKAGRRGGESGFVKHLDEPDLQISGWTCQGDGPPARRTAIGCILSRLILLTAGNDPKLAELFAQAELKRGSCTASAASADWVTGAENPRLRGTF
jgi:hypothetical protein